MGIFPLKYFTKKNPYISCWVTDSSRSEKNKIKTESGKVILKIPNKDC